MYTISEFNHIFSLFISLYMLLILATKELVTSVANSSNENTKTFNSNQKNQKQLLNIVSLPISLFH
jgi:hypothetical protein